MGVVADVPAGDGADDYDTLMAMHNLGSNLRALGRYSDALRIHEETRARREATLGVDHPDALISLWSVARDLIKLDRGALAVPLLDECLQRAVGKRVHRNFRKLRDFRDSQPGDLQVAAFERAQRDRVIGGGRSEERRVGKECLE